MKGRTRTRRSRGFLDLCGWNSGYRFSCQFAQAELLPYSTRNALPEIRLNAIRHEWDLPEIGFAAVGARHAALLDGFIALGPGIRYGRGNVYSRWRGVSGTELNLSLYITNHSVVPVRARPAWHTSIGNARGLQPVP